MPLDGKVTLEVLVDDAFHHGFPFFNVPSFPIAVL